MKNPWNRNKGDNGDEYFEDLLRRIAGNSYASHSLVLLRSRRTLNARDAERLCKSLRSNTTIEELIAQGHPIGTEGLKCFSRLLTSSNSTNGGNRSLKRLSVGYPEMGDEGIRCLMGLGDDNKDDDGDNKADLGSTLEFLDLEWRALSPAAAGRLLNVALTLPTSRLRELRLGRNSLGDKGVSDLFSSPLSRALETLDLHDNDVGARGVRALSETWTRGGMTMRRLDLSGNERIGKEGGLPALASVAVEELILDGVGADDEGVLGLTRGGSFHHEEGLDDERRPDPPPHQPRRLLSLGRNALTNEAVTRGAFRPLFASGLRALNLRENVGITAEGMEEIGKALERARSRLATLDLSHAGGLESFPGVLLERVEHLLLVGNAFAHPKEMSMRMVQHFREDHARHCIVSLSLTGTRVERVRELLSALGSHPTLRTIELGGLAAAAAASGSPLDMDEIREAIAQLKRVNPGLDVAVDRGGGTSVEPSS